MRVEIKTSVDSRLSELANKLTNTRPLMTSWAVEAAKAGRACAIRKGGKRFWGDVARSCNVREVTATGAIVYADHPGAALRQFGGTVRPVKAKALAIPIAPEAYGKSPREFSAAGTELFKIEPKDGDPDTVGILGYNDPSGNLRPLFALRTRSEHRPDPWWITDDEALAIGIAEAERHVAKQAASEVARG